VLTNKSFKTGEEFYIMSDQPVSAKHLTHLDEHGNVRMVDVTEKPETAREAIARAQVRMAPETVRLIETNQISKGSVLQVIHTPR
jgi:cyclic pyranopterin monophosphate synthase